MILDFDMVANRIKEVLRETKGEFVAGIHNSLHGVCGERIKYVGDSLWKTVNESQEKEERNEKNSM